MKKLNIAAAKCAHLINNEGTTSYKNGKLSGSGDHYQCVLNYMNDDNIDTMEEEALDILEGMASSVIDPINKLSKLIGNGDEYRVDREKYRKDT